LCSGFSLQQHRGYGSQSDDDDESQDSMVGRSEDENDGGVEEDAGQREGLDEEPDDGGSWTRSSPVPWSEHPHDEQTEQEDCRNPTAPTR
jgi:hypothetical protein